MTATNPLVDHPAYTAAAEAIAHGGLGEALSVYASVRSRWRDGDPLLDLGGPLLDYLLGVIEEPPEEVLATTEAVATDRAGGDAWLLMIRFRSGLVATIDLGHFLPDGYPVQTETRIEFCGTDRVVTVEPDRLAVTVIGRGGISLDDCYLELLRDRLADFANAVDAGTASATTKAVIEAARRSAETRRPEPIA
jgi:predicted dehydrogenase